jgi:hypothetical protein
MTSRKALFFREDPMAYKPMISEIITETVSLPAKDRAYNLKRHESDALKCILQYALDPRAEWLLPKGEIPYTPNTADALYTILYHEAKKLYLFVKGGNDSLSAKKRLILFIDFLEKLNKADAELMMLVKDQALPEEITVNIVNEAFPGLVAMGEKRGRGRPRKDPTAPAPVAKVTKKKKGAKAEDGQVKVQ